jgi:hypothetical protein
VRGRMGAMPKRKKTNRYRFRGNHSRLEERIAGVKAKLADPKDQDAKGWLTRWLKSAELRLSQKEKSLEAKQRERR